MKKILLSLFLLVFSSYSVNLIAQCSTVPILKYTGAPGDPGILAPLTIDGNPTDWYTPITGPFAYSGVAKGGYEGNPHTAPTAPGNIQIDGLKDSTGSNYDRDVPGQTHRDLRFFAFTYDQKNIFFYFRRPKNNTAQVTLYYFVDINADGFMKTGEPVIQLTFNNSGSDIAMGYYEAVNSNAMAAGSYDPVKGNSMVATVARAKNAPSTSEWEVGVADGWNMPGNFIGLKNGVNLPALLSGEVFDAATLIDQHPDGNEPGYGVEFAIPWRYLAMYTAAGADLTTSLDYQDVFTYHVSLVGGNSGISGAEDNAGGCCAGVASSASANISSVSSSTNKNTSTPTYISTTIKLHNNVNASTEVFPVKVELSALLGAGGDPIPAAVDPTLFVVKVSDSSAGVISNTRTFAYDQENPAGTFIYVDPAVPSAQTVLGLADMYFIVELFMDDPGVKSYSMKTSFEAQIINTNTSECIDEVTANVFNQTPVETPLPVKFKSFTANRSSSSSVAINWTTASEENSKGFNIQRNVGGVWQTIAYVPSQAVNGTSTSDLTYSYTDANSLKGVTQYRVQQVDLDGKFSYTDIRAIRGEGTVGKVIVYPNPSVDGKLNVVFDDNTAVRDVYVNDMQGRIVKSYRGITNNILVIEKLTSGFYTIKITNRNTAASSIEKVVVK